jgi:ADP-heptose:LPS heptosyltransferase
MKILLVRTDNIGDLVVSLPMIELIKQNNSEHEVWFLVRDYAKAVIEATDGVSGWLSWDHLSSIPPKEAIKEIKAQGFDMAIVVHPNRAASRLLWKARIPKRVGTYRRLYHLVHCNVWVNLARSGSQKHEGVLNTILFRPIFPEAVYESLENFPLPKLHVRQSFAKVDEIIDSARKTVILHPGSNGHGREWALSRWQALATKLDPAHYQVLVTGSPAEAERFADVPWPEQVENVMGKLTLEEFIALIAQSHGLIAGSTGPVHLAGGLGVHTLALQSSSPGRGPWRWKPLGSKAEFITVIPRCDGGCTQESCPCIEAIEVHHVLGRISHWSMLAAVQPQEKPGQQISVTN